MSSGRPWRQRNRQRGGHCADELQCKNETRALRTARLDRCSAEANAQPLFLDAVLAAC